MKKTFDWFQANAISFEFFDFKKAQLNESTFEAICQQIELNKLINQKGTTFKKLTPNHQAQILIQSTCLAILNQNLSIIKRPLILFNQQYVLGFNPTTWAQILGI